MNVEGPCRWGFDVHMEEPCLVETIVRWPLLRFRVGATVLHSHGLQLQTSYQMQNNRLRTILPTAATPIFAGRMWHDEIL
jgi:hypothetical protein